MREDAVNATGDDKVVGDEDEDVGGRDGMARSMRRMCGQCLHVVRRRGFVEAIKRPCSGCAGGGRAFPDWSALSSSLE